MSSRRPNNDVVSDHALQLRSEIQELKMAQRDVSCESNTAASPSLSFDDLSHTEKACASLGVGPEQFRPLGWLNNGHFDTLVKNNQIDDTLVRRLEAYKVVAGRG